MSRLPFLRTVPLFRAIDDADLEALDRALDLVEHGPGETVIHDGSRGSSLFLVFEGDLAVRKGGRELARLRRGDCVGEMALVDPAPRAADVVALTPCHLLRMTKDAFEQLVESNPRVLLELCRIFARRLRQTQAIAA